MVEQHGIGGRRARGWFQAVVMHQLGQLRPEFQRGLVPAIRAGGGYSDEISQLKVGGVAGVGNDNRSSVG